ncbi:MAG: MazG nucleotide pyrophosphohydrolase domain-containing protein [Planctomycetota bacterium]|nr:MazG nucleotide pyrophosphohydrolase domain-containing protein [Planctomycetota bacterium]
MKISHFQQQIRETYFDRDHQRGVEKNFLWFTEEGGELAEAIRKRDQKGMEEEMADVLAWLSTLANLLDIDLEAAAGKKYGSGCSRCQRSPCACPE